MDLENETTVSQIVNPVVVSTDELSSEIDMAGFRDLTAVVNVGESGDTLSGSVYIELEMQHSDTTGSGYVACADADITNAVTGTNTGTFALIDAAAEDDAFFMSQYIGDKQFVKVNVNVTGTHTNGTPIGASAVQSGENYLP